MSEIVERAVSAAIAELQRQSDEPRPGPWFDASEGPESVLIDGRVDIRAAVRAAIETMREPTPAMLDAADGAKPERVWDAMIEVALR